MKKLCIMGLLLWVIFFCSPALAESDSLFYRTIGAGAINATMTGSGGNWGIKSIRLHMSAAGGASENFVIMIDSANGSRYDTNLLTEDAATVKDLVWTPDDDGVFWLPEGDYIDITYANSNSRQWGLEIEWVQK